MKLKNCSSNNKGISYLELLISLGLSVLIFVPAYAFTKSVYECVSKFDWKAIKQASDIDDMAQKIRCAVDDERFPFHGYDNQLVFKSSTFDGDREYHLSGWQFRFYDGSRWSNTWGWDSFSSRPLHGSHGLPVAVEIKSVDSHVVRIVPVMVAVINGWPT